MSDSLILALDTATEHLSVAVLAPGGGGGPGFEVLGGQDVVAGRGTSRLLLTVVERALSEGGGTVEDLGAVVVGIGPGTFTGIRIAVATARAIGFALDIPVLGVSTLAALAASAVERGPGAEMDAVVAVVDARRGQVFAGLYERDGSDFWVRRTPYHVVSPASLYSGVVSPSNPRRAALAGEGATLGLFAEATVAAREAGGPAASAWAAVVETPVSAAFLVAGQERLVEPTDGPAGRRLAPRLTAMLSGHWREMPAGDRRPGQPGTPEAVAPLYVRSPDADVHITRMRDPFAS